MGALNMVEWLLKILAEEGPRGEAAAEALARRLAGRDAVEFTNNASKVGEQYMHHARNNPDFFVRGRQFADTEEGLAQQFDVAPAVRLGFDERDLIRSVYGDVYRGPKGSSFENRDPGLYEFHERPTSYGAQWPEQVLGRRPQFVSEFDAQGLNRGSGLGQKLYASAYGALRQSPDMVNASSSLTPVNAARRSFNQASAIARDPRLSKQILTADSQLRRLGLSGVTPSALHRMQPDQMVGALQLAGNASMLRQLGSDLGVANRHLLGQRRAANPSALRHLIGINKALQNVEHTRGWDDESLKELREALRVAKEVELEVGLGDKSARRLGLSLRALDGLDVAPLTNSLEFGRGGRVPRRVAPSKFVRRRV